MLFLTGVIAVFTVLIWRVYARMTWLLGAQESHSTINLELQARALGLKVVWWDWREGPTPLQPAHGKEIERDTVYIGLPEHFRKPQGFGQKLWTWFCGGAWV